MEDEITVDFEACVVCEYARHWDTYKFKAEIGAHTDAMLEEIKQADKATKFGYANEFKSTFKFGHFKDDNAPDWFKELLTDELLESKNIQFKKGFLVLRAQVSFTQAQFRNALKNPDGSPVEKGTFSDEDLIYVYKDFVVSTLSDYSFLFSLAANIARPGSLQISKRYLFADKSLIRTDGGTLNYFELVNDVSEKYSWPTIISLPVFDVWNWLVKIPGFTEGQSKTSLGRAIGAISYLLNDNYKDENHLSLVWILVGLEALYSEGDGNIGLKSQLMDKTEVFLGKRSSYKKEFGQMYNFRSRLIHGDKNFHYKNFESFSETKDNFATKLFESEGLALVTLISTLQCMSMKNLYELNFKTVVSG